jgi:Subtilase family/Secretion system C-terminal sorting domain
MLDACTWWNDPAFYPNGWFADLPFLTDSTALSFLASMPTTHSVDSIESLKPFFQISTVSQPNVVGVLEDGGVDTASVELPNIVEKRWWPAAQLNTNIVSNQHGNGVAVLMVGSLGNNYLGGGVAHDYPLRVNDIVGGTWTSVSITSAKVQMDTLYAKYSTLPWSLSMDRFSYNISHGIGNDPSVHAKITALSALQIPWWWQRFFFIKSAGNSGPGTLDAACTWPEIVGVGWIANSALWTPVLRSWSSTWPGIFGVADGQAVYSMRSTNWTWTTANGTSAAAPIVSWATMLLMSMDTTLTLDKLKKRFRWWAYDMWVVGYDTAYGYGYLRAYKSMQYAVVEDYPNIDMVDNFATPLSTWGAGTYVKDFTPKFFNSTIATARDCYYPNGMPIPYTVGAGGERIYHPVYTNAAGTALINGFTATNNQLTYIFSVGGCTHTVKTMGYSVNGLAVALPPPTPILTNKQNFTPPVCANNVVKVKVTNPPAGGSVAATLNGISVPYNASDSTITLSGWMSAPSDTLHVVSTNGSGSTAKDSIFTVQNALTPSVAIPAATAMSTCQWTTVTFTAPAVANTWWASISYQWYDNGVLIAWATTNPYTYPSTAAAGNHNIHVVATLTGGTGCYTSNTATSPVKTLTITAPTTPTALVPTASVTSVCVWSTMNFTFNGTVPWGSIYQWYKNGTAISGANATTFSTSAVSAPSDTVRCTVTLPAGGCYTTGNVLTSLQSIVTVNAVTTPVVLQPTASLSSICSGNYTTLVFQGSSIPSGSTYQWYQNGLAVSWATNTSFSMQWVSAPADTAYCVVTFPTGGCYTTGNVLTSASQIINVTLTTTPTSAPATISNTAPCLGTTITATANTTNLPASWVTYAWKVDGVVQSWQTWPIANINTTGLTAGAHSITYDVLLPNGCYTTGNTLSAGGSTITVANPTTPAASATNVSSSALCQGSATNFTLTTSQIPVTSTYQWYSTVTGQITGATSSSYSHTGVMPWADTIYCIITLPPGCYTTAGTPISTPIQSIMVNPNITPVSDMTPNNQSICITQTPSGAWTMSAMGGANYTHQLYWTDPSNLTTLVGTTSPGAVVYPALTSSPGMNKFYIKSTYTGGATCALQTVYSDTSVVDIQSQLVEGGTMTGPGEVCDTLNFSVTATPALTVANGSSAQLWKKVGSTVTALTTQTTVGTTPLNFTTNLPLNEQAEFFVTFTPPVGTCYLQGNSDTINVANNGMHKDTMVANGNTYTLQNPALGSTQRWQRWNTGTSLWEDIPGETGLSYTATVSQGIRVFSTKWACVSWSDSVNHVMVGINDQVKPEDIISIAPNPTNGLIHLGNLKAGDTYSFELVDMLGRSIKLITEKDQTSGGKEISIDMSYYAIWVYTIRVRNKTDNTWQVLRVYKR